MRPQSHRARSRPLAVLVAVMLLLSLVPGPGPARAGPLPLAIAPVRVDPAVLDQVNSAGQATFWVILGTRPDLSPAPSMPDWAERGQFVYDRLRATAAESQSGLVSLLQKRGADHTSFWIVNAIRVTGDRLLLQELAAQPGVEWITTDRVYRLPEPQAGGSLPRISTVEWNIDRIGAPAVWSTFGVRGEGVVVANIDSGVEYTHPALVNQYRGRLPDGTFDHNYSWFDPANICGNPSTAPCDNNGHGTHTMGTMVGDDGDPGVNQIGVAPRARWIAAKGCETSGCSLTSLLASGQWVLAPTDLSGQNPRPDLRPHVVNNSWGGGPGDPFFQAVVQAWAAAGVFPAFANGNAGPGCGSAGSPGDYPESYAVGAFDVGDNIAFFSSRGPSAMGGGTKPDIAAPGVDVRSSVPGSTYASFSGTSMATPHVAGTVALMWSAAPALLGDVSGTRALLDQTAADVADLTCGGTEGDNSVWGEGRLDALAVVTQSPRGPTGTLAGTVTDAATGLPVRGASVQVTGPVGRAIVTGADGTFQVLLPVGTYDLAVTAFGYLPGGAAGVVVAEDTVTVQDVALTPAPAHAVSGFVRDPSGEPVAGATVTVLDTPLDPVVTDVTGFYRLPAVPQGEYDLSAAAGRCREAATQHVVVSGDTTADFTLPRRTDSFGYFCDVAPGSYIEAGNVLPLAGDDASTAVTLPFPFTFYGQTYFTAHVATNGFLNFAAPAAHFFNESIPTANPPNAAIYPFWDDLFVDGLASVRTELLGEAPNRRFVIEWRNVHFFGDSGRRLDFEVVLHETGEIWLQYAGIDDDSGEQGGSATIGIEDPTGAVALEYAFGQPALRDGLAVRYRLPPSGFVEGRLTDANDGGPLAGAAVAAMQGGAAVRRTQAAADGYYRLQLPLGTYTVEALATRYEPAAAQVTLAVEHEVRQHDFALATARGEVDPAALEFVLPAGRTRAARLTLRNTGSAGLTFEVRETGGRAATATPAAAPAPAAALAPATAPAQAAAPTPAPAPASAAAPAPAAAPDPDAPDPDAHTTAGRHPAAPAVRPVPAVVPPQAAAVTPAAPGSVIGSWPAAGLGLAWGIGYSGTVWVSDPMIGNRNHEFEPSGTATGRNWHAAWAGSWPADMAYDPGRNLVCQLSVGGDNGIYCWDPDTGAVADAITGAFPWTAVSQRGLAYRPDDDTFYVAGWNEGVLYHVKGLSHADRGAVIGQCRATDGNISGLAWNPAFGVVWAATNSPTDTIYQLNPDTCAVQGTLNHPQPGGFNGAGLELDEAGNLWMVSQRANTVYLVESGVPAFVDVPWLTADPAAGLLTAGGEQAIDVQVDTTGLAPGVYEAILFIRTNSGRQPLLRVPVRLIVPAYQQSVNAGGAALFTDQAGDGWFADQPYATGSWGWLGRRSRTRDVDEEIAGTTEDALYQEARTDATEYRFDGLPAGVYQVDLHFAELQESARPGERLFDVIIENELVLPAHDIAAEVGPLAADVHTVYIRVDDGQLQVRLIPRVGFREPLISAIRVTHRPDR